MNISNAHVGHTIATGAKAIMGDSSSMGRVPHRTQATGVGSAHLQPMTLLLPLHMINMCGHGSHSFSLDCQRPKPNRSVTTARTSIISDTEDNPHTLT